MKIAVLVNQSTGYLTVDICNAFTKHYEKVILLAGKVETFSRQLSENVEVVEICQYDKSSILKRLSTWIRGSIQIKKFLSSLDEPVDVLYFTNPPMSYLWADKMKHRFGIVEYDIYPDALNNVKCPSFIKKWWTKRNREIFGKSVGIITLSDGMKDLLTQYVDTDKIKVIYNWAADEDVETVLPENNIFAERYALTNKFVVMYSGNIGFTHNVGILIELANSLRNYDDIRFLIIGEGGKKKDLEKLVEHLNLTNVIFSSYLPYSQIKYSFSCASIGLVSLAQGDGSVSVPSKTYNLLSYGLPILCVSSEDSELNKIITKYECGVSFNGFEKDKMKDFIIKCLQHRDYYAYLCEKSYMTSKNFTWKNANDYLEIFKLG